MRGGERVMRLKKQKRHRKVMRFYSACYSFREPYKVIYDGTFIHHLLVHDLTPSDSSLSRLLGTRVLLFTTRWMIEELKILREAYAEALEATHQLMTTVVFVVSSMLILNAIMRKGWTLRPAYSP